MESSRQVCQKIGSIWPCLGHCKILLEKFNSMYVDQEYTHFLNLFNMIILEGLSYWQAYQCYVMYNLEAKL
jgi:hypothetical protein